MHCWELTCYFALNKNFVILKFGIDSSFLWTFTAKWLVRMFDINLKHVSFRNNHTFTLIVLVLQVTVVLGMKSPGMLASFNCTKDPLPCVTVGNSPTAPGTLPICQPINWAWLAE